jgi:hypothetical protein
MGFFRSLFSRRKAAVARSSAVKLDDETRDLLLSAAGNVGGDLLDLVASEVATPEQQFVLSIEAGLFGIAAACHFYGVRYAPAAPHLSLALEVASAYRDYFVRINEHVDTKPLQDYFADNAEHAIATVLGALQTLASRPEQLFFDLSRILATRVRLHGGPNLSVAQINRIEEALPRYFEALMTAFRTLRGCERSGR